MPGSELRCGRDSILCTLYCVLPARVLARRERRSGGDSLRSLSGRLRQTPPTRLAESAAVRIAIACGRMGRWPFTAISALAVLGPLL